jgi:hypothetical protein
MDRTQQITWFAGLFEGEGTFTFSNGKPKRLAIQMTDLDVLNRVQEFFGGGIHEASKVQDHHKQSWVWYLSGASSVELVKEMLPYLLGRRRQRAEEYIEKYVTREDFITGQAIKTASLTDQVMSFSAQGLTQGQIANAVGYDRTYVNKIIRRNNDQ